MLLYTNYEIYICLFLLNILLLQTTSSTNNYTNLTAEFENYIQKFHKPYLHDQNEYKKRFKIFQKSLNEIERLNGKRIYPNSAMYGLTQFSDQSENDFKKLHLKRQRHPTRDLIYDSRSNDVITNAYESSESNESENIIKIVKKRMINQNLPLRVDWREKGVISDVLSQGRCGACWAHSVIETIESMVAIKLNRTNAEELSVQQAIDCSRDSNFGCHGGNTCTLLRWFLDNNITIANKNAYPNLSNGWEGDCKIESARSGPRVYNFTCEE